MNDANDPLRDGTEPGIEPDETLTPATVLPLLRTRWLGRSYHFQDQVSSTNDLAESLAQEGAPHGTVVTAESQTGGRGRLGRPWFSSPGQSLIFSLVLRPRMDPAAAPPLSLVAAVGLAETTAEVLRRSPTVKWPNDLLLDGRKYCGILVEMKAEARQIRHVIVGVGINVNQTEFSVERLPHATSLALHCQHALSRPRLLAAALSRLEHWFDRLETEGSSPTFEAWLTFADWLGQPITVNQQRRTIRGVALGLDPRGALRLRLDDGTEEVITVGDLEIGR